MRTGRFLAALLALLPALSLAEASVPNTPPGRALSAWLEAFNSGDRARAESFDKTYAWGTNLDDLAGWIAETGGYDLLDIYANDQTTIFFRVKARTNGGEEVGRITVTATAPVAVKELGTWRVPPVRRSTSSSWMRRGATGSSIAWQKRSTVLTSIRKSGRRWRPTCASAARAASIAPRFMALTSQESLRGTCNSSATTNTSRCASAFMQGRRRCPRNKPKQTRGDLLRTTADSRRRSTCSRTSAI